VEGGRFSALSTLNTRELFLSHSLYPSRSRSRSRSRSLSVSIGTFSYQDGFFNEWDGHGLRFRSFVQSLQSSVSTSILVHHCWYRRVYPVIKSIRLLSNLEQVSAFHHRCCERGDTGWIHHSHDRFDLSTYRLRICRTRKTTAYPTRVNNLPMQIYATATAIGREMSYPQIHLRGPFSWLSPPPMGRVLIVACYCAVVSYMMCYQAIVKDAYYYERIGFRAGWISATQVPLMYLLASKSNIIGYLIGSSHERLNWLHRWVSRTLLITVTVHGGFFMREWMRADFVKLELAMMPMVKYGLGGWAILVWTFLTSLSPLRRVAYEVFVLQHIVTGVIFLWVLYVHIPSYARYNVWFAIAAICFDRFLRICLLVISNIRLRVTNTCNRSQRMGHEVKLEAISSEITIITIKDVHLSWKTGQHVYLWLPWLGPVESHPFTIATPYKTPEECHCHEIQFAVRTQSGFSKRINTYAKKHSAGPGSSLTGFIAGPYGAPPKWQAYESLILISASTGASYTLPILEDVLSRSTNTCTKRLSFLFTVRDRCHIEYYEKRLAKALSQAKAVGIELDIEIAITGEGSSVAGSDDVGETTSVKSSSNSIKRKSSQEKTDGPYVLVQATSPSSVSSSHDAVLKPSACCSEKTESAKTNACCCAEDVKPGKEAQIIYSYSRPNISDFIRRTVEVTGGETSVAVCGGKSLVATVRNSVASLSDERAVHKGSGAQGIHLHVEEYCF